ncbi:MAG: CubicO group peptidase (beta-lactamase class C family) [Candidatus Azotimanducaceae bacterium]|jgi:CubicO group peptidase (beta-lactamase class C family)
MIDIKPSQLDLSAMHARMQWYVDEEMIPFCTTLVMDGTDVVDVKTFGSMDGGEGRPLHLDTIYRMYSNTKIITSVAAMMLWEAGKFDLDDPLEKFIPDFADLQVLKADAATIEDVEPAKSSITIRQLLSHTSGLSYGFIEPESIIDKAYMAAGVNALATGGQTLQGLCEALGKQPLVFQPGNYWRYSLATDVTARLIEVISGQPFDDFLKENIFAPLGMNDTDFYVPEDKQDRFSTMYRPEDFLDPLAKGLVKADDPHSGIYSEPNTFLSGGGGLCSTLVDYIKIIQLIVNEGEWQGTRLLKPETLDQMRTNQLPDGVVVNFPMWDMPGTTFGLGFALKESPGEGEPVGAIGEYHWGGMAGTHSWMSPGTGITAMCMTQRMPGFWHAFSHDFKRLVYEAHTNLKA